MNFSGYYPVLCRVVDVAVALAGFTVLAPLLLLIAAAVLLTGGPPVLFRQVRVGRSGVPFRLLKFRSMRQGQAGAQITAGGDRRVTGLGRILRKYKLDELPQLWNVLAGEMSLIGPRPEVPAFVDASSPVWREVLSVRPGITDLASLVYRHEERLLSEARDPETYYRTAILPDKLALNVQYLRMRSPRRDARIVAMTLAASLFPRSIDPKRIRNLFLGTQNT
ncbi:MAG: sugar transferase [Bryobacterales bacterium]|nr:sugar transferase [Bryobacterales bacterium]